MMQSNGVRCREDLGRALEMALRLPCSPCALPDGASAGASAERDGLAAIEMRAEESAASVREDERKFREEFRMVGSS